MCACDKPKLKTFVVKDAAGERHTITAEGANFVGEDGATAIFWVDSSKIIARFHKYMSVVERVELQL